MARCQETSGRAFAPWPPPLCSQRDPRDEIVLLDQDPSLWSLWDPKCHPIEGMAPSVLEGPVVVHAQDHRPFALTQWYPLFTQPSSGSRSGDRRDEARRQMLIQMLRTNLCPWGQKLSPRARERAPDQGTPGTCQVGRWGTQDSHNTVCHTWSPKVTSGDRTHPCCGRGGRAAREIAIKGNRPSAVSRRRTPGVRGGAQRAVSVCSPAG